MEIIIKGSAKEIADFVLAVQNQPLLEYEPVDYGSLSSKGSKD